MDTKLLNVVILGLGFMFVFTAFQTMSNIEKTLLESVEQEHPGFTGEAYTSLAIVYIVLAVFNWLAPSFISVTGPRAALVTGSVAYTIFIVTFFWPRTWFLYLTSALLGIGASVTWAGQGTVLTRCSTKATISRNSGIFWALFSCSMFFGNLFVYFQFQGNSIDDRRRYIVVGVLTCVAVVGIVILSLVRPLPSEEDPASDATTDDKTLASAWTAFTSAGKLFCTQHMLLLSFASFYTGIAMSFYTGVYGSAVGFTMRISDSPKRIVGLAGICIGAGEVIGGSLFGIMSSQTTRFGGRNPIVLIGFVCHAFAYILTYLNLPNNSPFGNTDGISFFDPPSDWLALVCALALGFGDSCFNTQIMSLLGDEYAAVSTAAFALFKFMQSLGAAMSFFYSSEIGLHPQLIVLLVFAVLGTVGFCVVEGVTRKRGQAKKSES